MTESRKRGLEPGDDDSPSRSQLAKTAKPNDDNSPVPAAAAAAAGDDEDGASSAPEEPAAEEADSADDAAAASAEPAAASGEDGGGTAAESAGSPAPAPKLPTPTAYAIKLLVSNNIAGSIIGKGGQTINQMQQQSTATIKVRPARPSAPRHLPRSAPANRAAPRSCPRTARPFQARRTAWCW